MNKITYSCIHPNADLDVDEDDVYYEYPDDEDYND